MKIDFKKTLPHCNGKQGRFDLLTMPPLSYLMIDGHGGPESEEFSAALESLYPVAYSLKFMSKELLERDYVVPPLEGLWWAEDMAAFTTKFDKSRWDWTAMIMLPDWIDASMVEQAVQTVRQKKSLPALDLLRRETLNEGQCVQILHLGAYSEEGPVLSEMHASVIPSQGLTMRGKHHEIYLNDFRRVVPEKLRTLLRQPVESMGLAASDD